MSGESPQTAGTGSTPAARRPDRAWPPSCRRSRAAAGSAFPCATIWLPSCMDSPMYLSSASLTSRQQPGPKKRTPENFSHSHPQPSTVYLAGRIRFRAFALPLQTLASESPHRTRRVSWALLHPQRGTRNRPLPLGCLWDCQPAGRLDPDAHQCTSGQERDLLFNFSSPAEPLQKKTDAAT